MILLTILLLLILAIVFIAFGYKKASLSFLALTIILLLLSGSGLFPRWLLKNLQSYPLASANQHWGKHNAIILLGAGTVKIPTTNEVQPSSLAYSRIYQAAYFYRICRNSGTQCTLIISGGDTRKTGFAEATIYQEKLVDLGINQADTILETHSTNTYQNAEFTSNILKSGNFDKIFLITAGLHLQRSLLYFSQFDVNLTPIAADYLAPSLSIMPLAYNIALTDFALHEYIGIIRFYIYNYMGWNSKVVSAGQA